MISIFVLNNPFPVVSGAKFVSACVSPRHKPFCIKGIGLRRDIWQAKTDHCLGTRSVKPHARFTFSSWQHETRWKWECKWYICLVFHTLDLFSSRLEALGDMLVNQSRVKGNDVSNVLPNYRRFSHEECECLHLCVLCLIHISPKVLTSTRDENVNQASDANCQTIRRGTRLTYNHSTAAPLNAAKVKISAGGDGQKPRKIGDGGVIFWGAHTSVVSL